MIFHFLVLFLKPVSAQEENTCSLELEFFCDHSQTTIIADGGIIVYVLSPDDQMLVSSTTYALGKQLKVAKGVYHIVIESAKYCTYQFTNFPATDDARILKVDLIRESDPDCTDEQNFEPHPTKFNN